MVGHQTGFGSVCYIVAVMAAIVGLGLAMNGVMPLATFVLPGIVLGMFVGVVVLGVPLQSLFEWQARRPHCADPAAVRARLVPVQMGDWRNLAAGLLAYFVGLVLAWLLGMLLFSVASFMLSVGSDELRFGGFGAAAQTLEFGGRTVLLAIGYALFAGLAIWLYARLLIVISMEGEGGKPDPVARVASTGLFAGLAMAPTFGWSMLGFS